ncbi:MAG: protein phosphatase 2C domain-containing protein [Nitrospira sp.]|nr:protein phosphatase 2C domain-containing protein [Nitrospira sp.]MDR4468779.1 protein phosphatase 2C domain-containing protein [Nitrospira sp.]
MNGWIGIGRSEVGLVRTVNQDAFTVVDQYGVWAVADGMGGHIGGDIAAQTAITTLKSHAASLNKSLCDGHPPPTDLLTTLIGRAHEAILDRTRSHPQLKGMGTTIVLLAIVSSPSPVAYLAHVGDSRAYRLRAGSLTPLTRDHSLIEKYLERGILTPVTAKTHPERHVLTRALGIPASATPTIAAFPIQEDDLVLLCSDGLTKMLEDDDIQRILSVSDVDPTDLCHRLVNAALDRGGEDNVTVVVVAHRPS